jgi:hypothetical protein
MTLPVSAAPVQYPPVTASRVLGLPKCPQSRRSDHPKTREDPVPVLKRIFIPGPNYLPYHGAQRSAPAYHNPLAQRHRCLAYQPI